MEIIITSKYTTNKSDVLRTILHQIASSPCVYSSGSGVVRIFGTNEEVHYTVKVK